MRVMLGPDQPNHKRWALYTCAFSDRSAFLMRLLIVTLHDLAQGLWVYDLGQVRKGCLGDDL